MSIKILKDHTTLSREVAREILSVVNQKQNAVLCLAAGDTPKLAYNLLNEMARSEKVDFSKCTFIGLDEWIGIPPDNEGSCFYFLQKNLFGPMEISGTQTHLFDALTNDLVSECVKMDEIIHKHGPIDFMLVGVGMNGHIGFNEPGTSPDLYSHVIDLDETTRSVGQKYFRQTAQLQKGITLGFRHLMESETVIMMASGSKKAEIIRKALEGPVTPEVPASIVRKHKRPSIMLDQDAADLLTIV